MISSQGRQPPKCQTAASLNWRYVHWNPGQPHSQQIAGIYQGTMKPAIVHILGPY